MSYSDFLKKHGASLPKQKTYNEFLYDNLVKPYFDDVNGLINDFNGVKAPDISKYGDYSSSASAYGSVSFRADQLKQNLKQLKNMGYINEYNSLIKAIDDIKWTADKNRQQIKQVTDFYSSFENEEKYNAWDFDRKMFAEHGELTAQQVADYIADFEKRDRNGYEEDFYQWVKNYDVNHGVSDRNYYESRLSMLEKLSDEYKQNVWESSEIINPKEALENNPYLSEISQLKAARNIYEKNQVFEDKGYSKYMEADDFEEISKKGANLENNYIRVNRDIYGRDGDMPYYHDYKEKYLRLTDEEQRVYDYLLYQDTMNGTHESNSFLQDMEKTLEMRNSQQKSKDIAEDMTAGGFIGAAATVGYNILSLPANIVGGIPAVLGIAGDLILGDDIDVYGESYALVNFANTVRNTTGEMIGNDAWNVVYQSLMSAADSFVGAYVFGSAYPVIMATTAAANQAKTLVEQGASDGQIIVGALASGLIEMATEKFSIEHFLDGIKPTTFKQWMLSTAQQALIEASEEVASEVLNKITDEVIRGSMSEFNQLVRKYEAEGLSRDEAQKKAAGSAFYDIFEAFVGGLISGAAGGGVQGSVQMHNFKAVGEAIINKGEVETVLIAAESMGKLDTEIAGQVDALNKFTKNNKNTQNNTAFKRMLGRVATVTAQNATAIKQDVTEKAVKNELQKRGVDSKATNKIVKIAGKLLSAQKLSSSEQGYLKHNNVAATIMAEIGAAQEQVKAESLPQSPAVDDVSSVAESPRQQSSALSPLGKGRDAAPQWAVDLVKSLDNIDRAVSLINYSLSGKTEQDNKTEVDRMVKLLSIASGKTTAEQEAEAGDIPYSRYIKEKESAAQKENTAENSGEVDINNLPTIVLSEKSELAERIKSSSESKYKVIRDFIFDKFGNKKIKLSDGLNAIIEKRDAQHIAHQADNKKTAEIAQLEKIIKMAVKLSEEKNVVHKKFDYFAYYGINVEFQGKRFALFLNVGRAKNSGSYHIYDITDWSKKRDIANHNGGLARPVGNALTNDVSNDIIDQNKPTVNSNYMHEGEENTSNENDFKGFTEVDVSEDGVTYETRLLHTMRGEKITTEGQAYIKKICKNLGIEVIFENIYTPKGKHADGYIDNSGVIHLDYHCSNPVEFVLKHELTHYGESSALYSNFCKAVISSEAFAQWINSKVKGDDNVTVKAAEYREQISRLYKRNGVKLNPAKQQSEMIANFVGEVLFSADTNGLERLTTNMTVKEKRSVIDYIKGFIAYIKEKLKKVKGVSSEIVELERKFNEIISTAEQNKTVDNSPSYSIAKDESGHYVKIDISQDLFDNKTIREQQDIAKKIIKSNFKGKVLKVGVNGSAYINKRSAEEYAYPANRRMESDVKESKMRAAPELENLLAVSKFVRNLPDDGRHPDATKGWDIYLTRFKIGKSMFKGEVKIKVTNRGYVFYDITQIEKLPVNSGQTVMNTAAASGSPSTDIIDDNSSYVNSNYMQEAKKYSIDNEKNTSERSESTNPESFSIPNETVKEISSDTEAGFSIKNQLENSRDKLNSMNVVASYNTTETFEYNQQVVDWVISLYEKIGYKVSRRGFGDIVLDKKRIKSGVSYTKSYAEKIAFGLLPDVLQKGIEIGTHVKHKNRPYNTITFAAPVELNGERGNMAVVVKQAGENYYKAHRIVMPDGTQMILDKKRDTAETAGGVEYNSGLSPTDNVSKDIVSQKTEKVKKNQYAIATVDDNNIENLRSYTDAVEKNKYSYESLINKPDMEITIVDDSVEYTPTAENRKNVVNEAIKNAASVGRTNENGNAIVYVEDIDTEVVVSKNGLRHGLDRRFEVVAPVTLDVGEILTHSIRINELIPKNENVSKSYVLIGVAKNIKNEPYIVSFVINRATNEISSVDVLYSVNTKTEPAGSISPSGFVKNTSYFTDSNISISDLLDLVNKYFPDILPEDVLRHYGYTSRPDGEIGKSALYSIGMEAADESDITEIPDLMAVIADRYKRGELSDEEYRIEVQDLLMRANEKFGVIETGELAEDKTQIPKRVTADESSKTKRWVRTVHESGILPEDIEVELDAKILKDALSYQIIGNKVAQRQANAAIQRGTAVKEWEAAVNGEGRVGKREIAIGETLLKLAAESNDTKEVMKLIAEVSEMGTRAGQIVQAMSMLKRMDGIGQLYYVKKSVDRINRDLDKRFAKKVKKGKLGTIPQVKINETLANQLAESKSQQDFDVTYEAMMQSIAEQVPSTFLDKWNAWRYFAMLFNPRTHIRNFFGNYGFIPTARFKDMLAAVFEYSIDESQRTKSVVVKKEYREFASKDFSEIEDIITGGGKMNPSDDIRDRQSIFETKWLEKLRKWNFDLLEKEDAIFLKKHYSHALGGFLQARGIDISKDINSAVMNEARKYAMQEAQKATYRDASAVATVLSNFTSRGGIVGNLVEGILPFKKTPINIVKRGIEYSPIGLMKTLTKGTYDLTRGNITASEYIDGIAGGLTGTGIVLIGALLSSLGFIEITGGFDDEEDDINRLLGKQEYAIEIGGASYTIDWMAPVCIPFFMGVEIQKALEENDNGNLWQSVKNVSNNALEPIINLSMLSGMQDVISSAKYSDGSAVVGSVLWNVALSYGSQALPSISGAVARTVDGKRRTTYIDKTSWVSDMGQMAINKLEAKIPLASMLRSEYVDEFGRTEESGNVFERAVQNFVSPGYYSKIEEDPVIEQLKELYEETGESVLPTKPKKYIDVNGERIHLRAEEYEEYARFVGQARYEYLEEFFESSESKRLTAEEKREVISDLYSYALAKGKTQHSAYELPKVYVKVYNAEANGISPIDYYNSKIATNVDNADTDGSGTVTKKEKLAAIKKMDLPRDIKAALIALYK